ncbi:MAG: shikimate kinase [Microthrixaceae bacterium]
MQDRDGRPVLFVGLPGSGKSSVAREVAIATGWPCIDLDAEVERRSGRTIAEIFSESGEARFRELEVAELGRSVAGPRCVISAGGGILDSPEARSLAGDCLVVWLRARVATLLHRLADPAQRAGRPLLAGGSDEDLRAGLEQLARRREPTFAAAADLVVDVDGHSVAEVSNMVLGVIGQRTDDRAAGAHR